MPPNVVDCASRTSLQRPLRSLKIVRLSVLLITSEVSRAASLQRALQEHSIASYWAMNSDRGWRALEDVAPDVVVIDHASHSDFLAFFSLLADARPCVYRLLLVHVSASLFARERQRGLLDAVVYEHTLVCTVEGLTLIEPRSGDDTEASHGGVVLPFPTV